MALTVVSAQAALARRLGEYAGLVDLPDLLGVGFRSLGLEADDLGVLTDGDLDAVKSSQLDQLYDVAQAEGIERILANLDPLALKRLGIDEDPAAIAARLRSLAMSLRLRIERNYGVGLRTLEGGIITFDFAQRGDETRAGEL